MIQSLVRNDQQMGKFSQEFLQSNRVQCSQQPMKQCLVHNGRQMGHRPADSLQQIGCSLANTTYDRVFGA